MVNNFWLLISDIASPYSLGCILVIYILYCFYKKQYYTGLFLALTSLSCILIVGVVKILVERARPSSAYLYLTDYSFPSAHASFATVFFLLVVYVAYKHYHRYWYLATCLFSFAMIVLVGLSRIQLSVHWTSDVFAGYFLGVILFYVFLSFFDKDAARHLFGLHKPQKRKYTRRNVRKPTVRKRKVATS